MTDTSFVALLSTISLAGFWVLLFRLYRDFCVDRFRQEMFALRDEFFDFADEGQIEFNHPAYGMLRTAMNGFIRFGHRLNLLRALIFFAISGRPEPSQDDFHARWSRALETVDGNTQGQLNEYLERMHKLVIKHLFANSPILVATVIVPLCVWILLCTLSMLG